MQSEEHEIANLLTSYQEALNGSDLEAVMTAYFSTTSPPEVTHGR